MSDVLDDIAEGLDDDEPLGPPPGDLFVCDKLVDGKPCGASFDTAGKLNGHVQGKHRDRSGDAKRGEGPKGKPRRDERPATKRAADKVAAVAPSSRTATYESSIAMLALMGHIAIPAFDDYDLQVVTSGAHNLANALDTVGDKHEGVRQACDLILGGGTGGAYVQLVIAVAAIAAPIAAHHGLLPASVGTRFGATIGVVAETTSPVQVPQPEPDAPTSRAPNTADWTVDDYMTVITGMPPHIGGELAGRLMTMGGPIGVEVPGTAIFDIPDDRGPNGIGPEPVPAAERPDS